MRGLGEESVHFISKRGESSKSGTGERGGDSGERIMQITRKTSRDVRNKQ